MELFTDAPEGFVIQEFKGRLTDRNEVCCRIALGALGRFFRDGISLYRENIPFIMPGEDVVPVLPFKDVCPSRRYKDNPLSLCLQAISISGYIIRE